MGHASISCFRAGSSVSSVHATAYEAIDHMAITATVLVACVHYDEARGTDAMSDGTRLH